MPTQARRAQPTEHVEGMALSRLQDKDDNYALAFMLTLKAAESGSLAYSHIESFMLSAMNALDAADAERAEPEPEDLLVSAPPKQRGRA
ncbi:hypothetical protein PCS_02809 [Desulfocurvibacter africanus PCS]|uniref:Uncharacterized protein n=1 Tax=Desulfocurvibacter africanus PCS TaxID=1262666 RepID=M5Q011_DESAF|nr:hypothetical protein [Desulfocurvibacter africanus]EMG36306.1 hypothetical protein PCS_02809 [Desulfocurvibacter africanus PCS]